MGRDRRNVEFGNSIGAYSSAVVAGGFCFVSGQAALDESGQPLGGNVEEQTHATIRNLEGVLRSAGYELRDVVKLNCYLDSIDNWSIMNEVFAHYFSQNPPARATVQAELIYGCRVEMDCIAWKAELATNRAP